MVDEGATVKVYGLETTTTGVDDSECTSVQGAVPVKAIERVAEFPLQMLADPLIKPVGAGLTITNLLTELAQPLLAVTFNKTVYALATA